MNIIDLLPIAAELISETEGENQEYTNGIVQFIALAANNGSFDEDDYPTIERMIRAVQVHTRVGAGN